jgi:hypothetical protein
MAMKPIVRIALGVWAVLELGACVSLPPNATRSPQDPWESWNRGVYRLNDAIDRAVAKPVARSYLRWVPQPIRTGVTNVFSNLETPTVMVNDALQGKLRVSARDSVPPNPSSVRDPAESTPRGSDHRGASGLCGERQDPDQCQAQDAGDQIPLQPGGRCGERVIIQHRQGLVRTDQSVESQVDEA